MCKTIKQKIKFKAPPLAVYELLTDPIQHRAFTGKAAFLERKAGGRFSSYGGAIEGIVVDLLPGKRVVQAWRAREFPAGIYSMATFNLSPAPGGGTELVLTHRGVPKDLIPRIVTEWRERYWEKMKDFLATRGSR